MWVVMLLYVVSAYYKPICTQQGNSSTLYIYSFSLIHQETIHLHSDLAHPDLRTKFFSTSALPPFLYHVIFNRLSIDIFLRAVKNVSNAIRQQAEIVQVPAEHCRIACNCNVLVR